MNTEKASSSSQLLYSEYINTSAAKHVVQLIESKSKEKPVMKFTRSSVLPKILDLLPRLKQGEVELKAKDESARNIEVYDENCPVIEMNVAIPKECTDHKSSGISDSEDESNYENKLNRIEELSSESSSTSSEESDEENRLSPVNSELDKQQSLDSLSVLQSKKPLTLLSLRNLIHGKTPSESKNLNLDPSRIEDLSVEPPSKKMCRLD